MADRLMRANAYTTLDLVDATATGHDFEEDAFAVVNATTDRENPDRVRLQLELENVTEAHLPAHTEEVQSNPDQARQLAADLEKRADRVERSEE